MDYCIKKNNLFHNPDLSRNCLHIIMPNVCIILLFKKTKKSESLCRPKK